jgi:hypothetical protein
MVEVLVNVVPTKVGEGAVSVPRAQRMNSLDEIVSPKIPYLVVPESYDARRALHVNGRVRQALASLIVPSTA